MNLDDSKIETNPDLKKWLLRTNRIPISKKRYYLNNWEELKKEDLSTLENIRKDKFVKENKDFLLKILIRNIFIAISWIYNRYKLFFKIIFLWLVTLSWFIFSTPAWIKVNWFPFAVWKVRDSLNKLEDFDKGIYNMVINNINEINVDYFERPSSKWWHAFSRDWETIVRVYRPFEVEDAYFLWLIVHEACHGVQFKDGRFETEPRQKCENECTYLWLYVMEEFWWSAQLIKSIRDTAEDPNGQWWNWWKDNWTMWDTTNWLMDLLPKEKQREYTVFWDIYDYWN